MVTPIQLNSPSGRASSHAIRCNTLPYLNDTPGCALNDSALTPPHNDSLSSYLFAKSSSAPSTPMEVPPLSRTTDERATSTIFAMPASKQFRSRLRLHARPGQPGTLFGHPALIGNYLVDMLPLGGPRTHPPRPPLTSTPYTTTSPWPTLHPLPPTTACPKLLERLSNSQRKTLACIWNRPPPTPTRYHFRPSRFRLVSDSYHDIGRRPLLVPRRFLHIINRLWLLPPHLVQAFHPTGQLTCHSPTVPHQPHPGQTIRRRARPILGC